MDKEIEKRAKAAALSEINAERSAIGIKPLKRVEKMWWELYGREYVAKQIAKENGLSQ